MPIFLVCDDVLVSKVSQDFRKKVLLRKKRNIDSLFFFITNLVGYLCERCENNYRSGETKINKKKEIHVFFYSGVNPIQDIELKKTKLVLNFLMVNYINLGHNNTVV